MVVGRLCSKNSFFTSLLLLCLCLQDAEAQSTIHKKVGDTVELSPGLPSEGVDVSQWKYNGSLITNGETVLEKYFKDRLHLDTKNFVLTVRGLMLQDSGTFTYISSTKTEQRPTVTIKLEVHEPLTKPALTSDCTCASANSSCSVFIECSAATTDSKVTYKWTVGDQIISGSRLQYNVSSQNKDNIEFTCTASNIVSEVSASKTVTCNRDTQEKGYNKSLKLYLAVGAGSTLLMLIILVTVIYVCYHKQAQRAGSDSNDLTVYADVADIAEDKTNTLNQNAVYETIHYEDTPQPMTVYDQIQSSRITKPPGSSIC